MKKVCVIGAGTMGNGIAHVFAQYDFKTVLIDNNQVQLESALKTIRKNLERQVKKGIISLTIAENTITNISVSTLLQTAVIEADLVIEAVTEDSQLKQQIFSTLSQHCRKNCILASNTSSISIQELSNHVIHPERVIGMHFMNPVPIMQLVEVIKTHKTSAKTVDSIMKICAKLDKKPVLANDFPGFVANRILMPMINEAILALEEGVAGVTEIDEIMVLGMAHPMGPLQLADFIGLDVCLSILNILEAGFKNKKYKAAELLRQLVSQNLLGKKSGEGFYNYSTPVPQAKKFN